MNKPQTIMKTTRTLKIKQLNTFIRKIYHELLFSHNASTIIVVLFYSET